MVSLRMAGVGIFERAGCNVVAPHGLVNIMEWTKVERAFAVEAYFSNGRSIIATQRALHTHFNIAPRGRVPGRQSIISWVNHFRVTGDVKKKTWGFTNIKVTPKL